MSLSRRAKRRDGNEGAIVAALRAVGAHVWPLDTPVDLLVLFRGVFYLIEVKDRQGRNRLQDSQRDFFEACEGAPAGVVWNEDDALRLIGAIE